MSVIVLATAAAFTFAVTATAAAFTFAMSATAAFAAATATTAFTAHLVDEFLNFGIGGIAESNDLATEVEILACEGVIEVYYDLVFFYFEYDTLKAYAVSIDERKYGTGIYGILVETAVDLENLLVEFEYTFFHVRTVGFVLLQKEIKFLTFAESENLRFK